MSNTVKYCPDGGRIALVGHPNEHELTVSVSDVGLGLPPVEFDKIFERFHRVVESSRGAW